MIRVAHLFDSMRKGGGAEASILTLIRGLDRSRFEPFLILNDRKQPEHDLTGINLLPPRCAPGAKPWWRETRFARDVAGEVRERGIHVVHSHAGSTQHDRLALRAAHKAGALVVRTLRGIPPGRPSRTGLLARFFERYTTAWTVISPDLASVLTERYGIHPEKISVIPNGIALAPFVRSDEERPSARRALGLEDDDFAILSIGRLAEVKDYPTILEAVAAVRGDFSRLKVLIAGEGPDRARIEERIAALGLGETVRLLGLRDDVPALLAACDLFVQASIREGFGRAVAEAMAAGRPVIATDVPGPRYLLDGGAAGVVVPVRAPGQLAEAIRALAGDADRRETLAARARARALSCFSEKAMIEQYQRLYQTLLSSSAGKS